MSTSQFYLIFFNKQKNVHFDGIKYAFIKKLFIKLIQYKNITTLFITKKLFKLFQELSSKPQTKKTKRFIYLFFLLKRILLKNHYKGENQ